MTHSRDDREQTPLLQRSESDDDQGEVLLVYFNSVLCSVNVLRQIIDFTKDDQENPRNWPKSQKLLNVAIIALMASKSSSTDCPLKTNKSLVLSPLASSMFTPGINQIAEDLKTTPQAIVGATTGFVILQGIGPLILAPLSETFGRRRLYTVVGDGCFTRFQFLGARC